MEIALVSLFRFFEIDVENYQFPSLVGGVLSNKSQAASIANHFFDIQLMAVDYGNMFETDLVNTSVLNTVIAPTVSLADEIFSGFSYIRLNTFNNFAFFLWLEKDNSIYCPEIFAQSRSVPIPDVRSYHQRGFNVTYKADGSLQTEIFTQNDLDHCVQHLQQFLSVANPPLGSLKAPVLTGVNLRVNYSNPNTTSYVSINRIIRGKQFIDDARKTQLVIGKVSMYICAIETLFTSGTLRLPATRSKDGYNKEAVGKIVAMYLQAELPKQDCYSHVVNAYIVRNKYFHGTNETPLLFNQQLITTSREMDHILRIVFKKILYTDSAIFLDETNITSFLTSLHNSY